MSNYESAYFWTVSFWSDILGSGQLLLWWLLLEETSYGYIIMLDGVEICKSAIYSVQSTERVSDTYLQYFQKKSYNCILKKKTMYTRD